MRVLSRLLFSKGKGGGEEETSAAHFCICLHSSSSCSLSVSGKGSKWPLGPTLCGVPPWVLSRLLCSTLGRNDIHVPDIQAGHAQNAPGVAGPEFLAEV